MLRQNPDEDDLRAAVRSRQGAVWVDLHKPTPDEIFLLDEVFGFHPLTIEDCQNISRVPKLDEYGSYLFIVFLAPNPKFNPDVDASGNGNGEEPTLELDLFVGPNYVVTYHTTPLPFLQGLVDKGKRDAKRFLLRPGCFLAHDILDAAVDQFFAMVDRFEDETEEAEDKLLKEGNEELFARVLELKRRLLRLRRQMSGHREVIQRLVRGNHPAVVTESQVYFRDVLDHLSRIETDLDACRDTIDNARDVYLAVVNVKMQEVMKVLTVIFAVTMPFALLTSWFGMNFEALPVKEHPWGPWLITGLSVGAGAAILFWLRAKRWF